MKPLVLHRKVLDHIVACLGMFEHDYITPNDDQDLEKKMYRIDFQSKKTSSLLR